VGWTSVTELPVRHASPPRVVVCSPMCSLLCSLGVDTRVSGIDGQIVLHRVAASCVAALANGTEGVGESATGEIIVPIDGAGAGPETLPAGWLELLSMLLTQCTKQALVCTDNAGNTALDVLLTAVGGEPALDAWKDAVGPQLWKDCMGATSKRGIITRLE
jgi:hypothetical protein